MLKVIEMTGNLFKKVADCRTYRLIRHMVEQDDNVIHEPHHKENVCRPNER